MTGLVVRYRTTRSEDIQDQECVIPIPKGEHFNCLGLELKTGYKKQKRTPKIPIDVLQ